MAFLVLELPNPCSLTKKSLKHKSSPVNLAKETMRLVRTKNFVTFFQRNFEKEAICGIVLASAINLLTTSSFIESDTKATFCKTEFFFK